MSATDEIKAIIDIVDLISESVQLRRSGKNQTGFCPFHPNSRTPAFVVFPETGTWRCFGQCNEGGDIFRFLMKKEGWDFPETLRYLADKAGIQLKPPTPEEQAIADENEGLRSLLEESVTFYRHYLTNTSEGRIAFEYLREKRELQIETIESFGLGYAPNSWDSTISHFKSKGYSNEDLIASGLVSERDSGGIYDRFRNRVLFPIRDERSRMTGFGARVLNPDDVPKFLNSPQNALFDKGRLLYGMDHARRAIRTQDQVVIVEGYLDVIALHQAGFSNTVSPMGTALTEQQLYLLKRYSRRIVLALDPDVAGDKATLRGLQIARQTMEHEQDPVFDARGLIRHEARLKADIRVTALPDGMDPDEVVNENPGRWRDLVENARPIVIHVMETLTTGRDLDDPKVKTEIASQILPLIMDVPSSIERDTYLQRLARLIRVDERALQEDASIRRRSKTRKRSAQSAVPVESAASRKSSRYSLEMHCLGVLLRRPDLLYKVDRIFQEDGLNRLSPEDFQHVDHRAILHLFQESLDQDIAEPVNFVFDNLSLSMMDLADKLLAGTAELDPNEDRVFEDLMRGLLELRLRNLHQNIEYLRFLMEEAQNQGDSKATHYLQTMSQHTQTLRQINTAFGKYTSRSLLVKKQEV